jgi:hypothetical protein
MGNSAFWRKRVVAVRIAFPNPAVATVNEQLGALVPGDLPRAIDSLPLGAMNRAGPLAAGATDGPAIGVGYNVLISLAHMSLLIIAQTASSLLFRLLIGTNTRFTYIV